MLPTCAVCGSEDDFILKPVVTKKLARQWRLSRIQRTTINVQQGHVCVGCGNNLRARSLASGFCNALSYEQPLAARRDLLRGLSVLEINPAAALTVFLGDGPGHTLTRYPSVDMQELPFAAASFDVVMHSDVLEHVENASLGIFECLRVAGDGWVLFTTPIVTDRRTRHRGKFARRSYHGGDSAPSLVRHEFGTDLWVLLMEAGAREIVLCGADYPYSVAVACVPGESLNEPAGLPAARSPRKRQSMRRWRECRWYMPSRSSFRKY